MELTNLRFSTLDRSILYKRSGIYLFEIETHKYVGSSKNLYDRLREHRSDLTNNKHSNSFLQNTINKYGIENVSISIIEYCDPEIRVQRETYWYKELQADINLMDPESHEFSEESKEKLRKSMEKARAEGKLDHKMWLTPIQQFDLWGNFIKEYPNLKATHEETNISEKEIKRCCGGYRKGCCIHGYRFKYKDNNIPVLPVTDMKKCACYFDFYYKDSEGNEVKAFDNAHDVWSFFNKVLRENPKEIIIIPKLKDIKVLQMSRQPRHDKKVCESGNVLIEENPNPSAPEME